MKNRYIIYVVVGLLCVVAIIAGVYYQVSSDKPEKPEYENTQKPVIVSDEIDLGELRQEFIEIFDNTFDDQGYDMSKITKLADYKDEKVIFAAYSFTDEKDEVYSVNINLPVFNVEGEVAANFNSTTQKIFADKANDVLSKTGRFTIYNVEYKAYLNENILSVVIKSTLKEGNSAQRTIVQTYNYDIVENKALTLNDVLLAKGIGKVEANKQINKIVKQADKEARAVTEALASQGQIVYERNINDAMYVTDNVNNFFVGEDGQVYVIYAYGNNNYTSEIDVIKL